MRNCFIKYHFDPYHFYYLDWKFSLPYYKMPLTKNYKKYSQEWGTIIFLERMKTNLSWIMIQLTFNVSLCSNVYILHTRWFPNYTNYLCFKWNEVGNEYLKGKQISQMPTLINWMSSLPMWNQNNDQFIKLTLSNY